MPSRSRESAERRAALELAQTEIGHQLTSRRMDRLGRDGLPETDRVRLDWMHAVRRKPLPGSTRPERGAEPKAGLGRGESPATRLARAGFAVRHASLDMPTTGIHVGRALVPGLCTIRPPLVHQRLVEVPVRMAWREPGFAPCDPRPLPLLL